MPTTMTHVDSPSPAILSTAIAEYDFASDDADKLTFRTGQTVCVLERHASGWWSGMILDSDGSNLPRSGWFPGAFVKELAVPVELPPPPPPLVDIPAPLLPSVVDVASDDAEPEAMPANIHHLHDEDAMLRAHVGCTPPAPKLQLRVDTAVGRISRKNSSNKSMKKSRPVEGDDAVSTGPTPARQGNSAALLATAVTTISEPPVKMKRKSRRLRSSAYDRDKELPPITPSTAETERSELPSAFPAVDDGVSVSMSAGVDIHVTQATPSATLETLSEATALAQSEAPIANSSANSLPATHATPSLATVVDPPQTSPLDTNIAKLVRAVARLNRLDTVSNRDVLLHASKDIVALSKQTLECTGLLAHGEIMVALDVELSAIHRELMVALTQLVESVKLVCRQPVSTSADIMAERSDADATSAPFRVLSTNVLKGIRRFVHYSIDKGILSPRPDVIGASQSDVHSPSPLSATFPVTKASAVPTSPNVDFLLEELSQHEHDIKSSVDDLLRLVPAAEARAVEINAIPAGFTSDVARVASCVRRLDTSIDQLNVDVEAESEEEKLAALTVSATRVALRRQLEVLDEAVAATRHEGTLHVLNDSVREVMVTARLVRDLLRAVRQLLDEDMPLTATTKTSGPTDSPLPSQQVRSANSTMNQKKLQKFFGTTDFSLMTAAASAELTPLTDEEFDLQQSGSGSKLQKLLGELPRMLLARRAGDGEDASYLRGASNGDLILNMEGNGQVKAGTLEALVERLTSPEAANDLAFTTSFLLSFKNFTTPELLLDALRDRLLLQPTPVTPHVGKLWSERKQRPIHLRVYHTLKLWLEEHWYAALDDEALPLIEEFARADLSVFLTHEADRLVQLCERRRATAGDRKYRAALSLSGSGSKGMEAPPPAPILMRLSGEMRFTELDPMELARQLTILESRLFHSIHPMDYLFYRADDQTTAEPIRRMIRHANRITGWVGEMILRERDDPRRRADIIKFFVKLAEKCHVLNNFATREAILSALNATPIYRLKHTWAQVTPKTKASFDSLMRFMDRDRNFQTYRTALRTASPPCIPFIGLFLTDVNFIAQGNADRVGEDARLVNFDKFQKMAAVVGEIRRFQESSHNFVILDEVQEFLARQLRKSRDVQQLHGLSLEVESRVTGTEPSPAVTPTMPKASAIEEKTTIGSVSVPTAASVDISK